MIVLFNGCFTTDFALEIFKLHFSQKGIFTEFLDAPPRLFFICFYPFSAKFGSVTYERLLYKPIEPFFFLMNSVEVIPG